MDVRFAALLRVQNAKLTDFAAIMPRNVQQSTIAHLATHFGKASRLIEHHIDLVRLISRQHGFDNRFGF